MSGFGNFLSGIGALGNLVGVQGDDANAGLNAMQRAGMAANDPNAAANFDRQSALARLASDPAFQQLDPAAQQLKIAALTGNPAAISTGSQMNTMENLDLSNPQGALKKLAAYMQPSEMTGLLTNPMASGMLGGAGVPPATATPPGGSGGSLGGTGAPATPGAPAAPAAGGTQPDDGRNWNYLNSSIPAFYRNQVLDYSQGGELSKDVSPKDRTMIANWAHNFDPSFTELTGAQRNATVNDFSSKGNSGKALTSIGTGTKHLAQMALAVPALQNGSWHLSNYFGNTWGTSSGNDAQTTFSSLVNTVAPEIAKAANSGGDTSDGDRDAQRKDFDVNGSPQQLMGSIATKANLLSSKAEELQGTYRKNMGPVNPNFNALSQQTKQTQQDLVALYSISKIDPDMKGPQAQAVIARLQKAVAVDDSQYLPQMHDGSTSKLAPQPGPAPKAAAPAGNPGAAQVSKEEALAELRRRGKIQ